MAEYNLIQNPDLLRRLTKLLGLRQAHISPALDENVTPVVVLADVARETAQINRTYMAGGNLLGDAINNPAAMLLRNPLNSGIVARVLGFEVGLLSGSNVPQQFKMDVINDGPLPTQQEVPPIRGRSVRNGGATLGGGGAQLLCEFGGGSAGDHMLTRYLELNGTAAQGFVFKWSQRFDTPYWDFFLLPGRALIVCMDQATNDSGYGSFFWQELPFDPSYMIPTTQFGV